MPIQLQVFHPDQIVVVVARGTVTIEEYQKFLAEVVENGALFYRKIFDVTSAIFPAEGQAEMLRQVLLMDARMREALGPRRGPIAFVVDPARGQIAREYERATENDKERPFRVFHSLYEARRWLSTLPIALRVEKNGP